MTKWKFNANIDYKIFLNFIFFVQKYMIEDQK